MALSADAIILIGNIVVYCTLLTKIQNTMFHSGSYSLYHTRLALVFSILLKSVKNKMGRKMVV
jgi:hypothetical protein